MNVKAEFFYETRDAILRLHSHDLVNMGFQWRMDRLIERWGSNEKLLRDLLWVKYGSIAEEAAIYNVMYNMQYNSIDATIAHGSLDIREPGAALPILEKDCDKAFMSRLKRIEDNFSF